MDDLMKTICEQAKKAEEIWNDTWQENQSLTRSLEFEEKINEDLKKENGKIKKENEELKNSIMEQVKDDKEFPIISKVKKMIIDMNDSQQDNFLSSLSACQQVTHVTTKKNGEVETLTFKSRQIEIEFLKEQLQDANEDYQKLLEEVRDLQEKKLYYKELWEECKTDSDSD